MLNRHLNTVSRWVSRREIRMLKQRIYANQTACPFRVAVSKQQAPWCTWVKVCWWLSQVCTGAATVDRFSVMFCLARPGGGDQETSCQGLILVIIMVVTQDTDHCLQGRWSSYDHCYDFWLLYVCFFKSSKFCYCFGQTLHQLWSNWISIVWPILSKGYRGWVAVRCLAYFHEENKECRVWWWLNA